ncbi:MAG: hypothetical protein Hyperionvirus22_19 [Hyperionvirus sp.]|uniref:Uncharacterized protein n=1 Tax=Hyperionvirus sp. TaxID=2487770 RepID=A0A3G5AAQ6_9VIRU|nr:MAG: hypothetical protein Hyperionvirus22_19 [Hyperionvirus sp.]
MTHGRFVMNVDQKNTQFALNTSTNVPYAIKKQFSNQKRKTIANPAK